MEVFVHFKEKVMILEAKAKVKNKGSLLEVLAPEIDYASFDIDSDVKNGLIVKDTELGSFKGKYLKGEATTNERGALSLE
ncbi:hypothetical protein VNO78_07299 [Psophocarpus tetragonolobus]|uniref:Uncharacterized protein n=1 Tax=Psophocarpus tetragonolobus TaxID=3891 RepID=A0AAN9SUE3_PSOTE